MTGSGGTAVPNPLDREHRRRYRIAGSVAGVALVAGALVAVARNHAVLDLLAGALRSPDWPALATLVATVVVIQALTAGSLWILMRRLGPVRPGEMWALVAAGTLANYVPLQAGSIGRIAFHRAVHGIPVRASLVALLGVTVAMAAAIAAVGAVAWSTAAWGGPWWAPCSVPAAFAAAACVPRLRTVAMLMTLRTAEVLAWSIHAWAAFRLSGWSVEPGTAIGASLAASAANLVPFVGNGLGLREWAVAIAAPLVGGYEQDAGLAAELLARAVDVAVTAALGAAAMGWLIRTVRVGPRQATG